MNTMKKNKTISLTKHERAELVVEAKDLLRDAISNIRKATDGDRNIETYLIAPLEIRASSDHGYLTRDPNCDDVLQKIWDGLYDEDGEHEA